MDLLSFNLFCSAKLREMMLAFLSFDCTSLRNEDISTYNIWNGTTLFSRQGLFFEYPFLPLHFQNTKNRELSDFRPRKD